MPDQEPAAQEPEQLRLMRRMVELAEYQTELSKRRTQLSEERSRLSADRSEYSEHRSFLSTERTLSVWIRTALALMAAGIAVDKLALFLSQTPARPTPGPLPPHALSTLGGAALVAFGTLMAFASGTRFLIYSIRWRRVHKPLPWHGPYLAFAYAVLTVACGVGLLVAMLLFT